MKPIKSIGLILVCTQVLSTNVLALASTTTPSVSSDKNHQTLPSLSSAALNKIQETNETTGINKTSPSSASVSSVPSHSTSSTTISKPQFSTKSITSESNELIKSTWGTASVTFDKSTGALTVSDGEITKGVHDGSYYLSDQRDIKREDVKNITFGDNVKLPTDSTEVFAHLASLTSLDLSQFDTSKVNNMDYMFADCSGLTNLNLSQFNTSMVTKMMNMFSGCSGLTNLDLSNFDTSMVNDMMGMFSGCSGLTNLDLSNFDTSMVTKMMNMFAGCSGLTNLDLSNFDTSKVDNMMGMFSNCSGLTNLNLGQFNTSMVTKMMSMFAGCSGLTNLDLKNFDTSKVDNMMGMFYGCSDLTNLDLSNFDTSKVNNMTEMFNSCDKLNQLTLGKKSVFHQTDTNLPAIDTSSEQYSGAWVNKKDYQTYDNSQNFMSDYDGSDPGTYVWGQTIKLKTKDTAIDVGTTWSKKDNFVSCKDELGKQIDLEEVNVSGTVDTTKAGVYDVTYSYGGQSATAKITVKENKTSINVKDTTLYVGDHWQPKSDFVSATDKDGNPVDFSKITFKGNVDTNKAGIYEETYINGNMVKKINVKVLNKKIVPSSNSNPKNMGHFDSRNSMTSKLPRTGEVNSNWIISLLGIFLIGLGGLISFFTLKIKKIK